MTKGDDYEGGRVKLFARRVAALMSAALAVSSCGGRSPSSVPSVHDYRTTQPGTVRITPQSACYWSFSGGWTCGGAGGGSTGTPGPCDISSQANNSPATARTEIGVGEQVTITTTGLGLYITSGQGALSSSSSPSALTASDTAGSVTVSTGARGRICTANSITFTVDAPRSTYLWNPGNIAHSQGFANIGMHTGVYLSPSTVSFLGVFWQELERTATANQDGTWYCLQGQGHHPGYPIMATSNNGLGSFVGVDEAYFGYCYTDKYGSDQYLASRVYVYIPTQYSLDNATWHDANSVLQQATDDTAGHLIAQKDETSGDTYVNNPDSGY